MQLRAVAERPEERDQLVPLLRREVVARVTALTAFDRMS